MYFPLYGSTRPAAAGQHVQVVLTYFAVTQMIFIAVVKANRNLTELRLLKENSHG